MNHPLTGKCGRTMRLLLFLLPIILVVPILHAQQPAAIEQSGDPQIDQMKQTAYAEHEIVKELIRQRQFDRVLPEMRKIFALNLPDQEEDKIGQSASIIAELLVEQKQFALAHNVLDEACARMNRNPDKASVLKINAWVYSQQGDIPNALKTMKLATEYEKSGKSPQ